MIIFTLGMMVADIVTSASPAVTLIHDTLAMGLGAVAGFLAESTVTSLLLSCGGEMAFVVGLLTGLIVGFATGMLVDLLFSLFERKPAAYSTTKGWKDILGTKLVPVDGKAILTQIMHNSHN